MKFVPWQCAQASDLYLFYTTPQVKPYTPIFLK